MTLMGIVFGYLPIWVPLAAVLYGLYDHLRVRQDDNTGDNQPQPPTPTP